jgi:hypothetical protein
MSVLALTAKRVNRSDKGAEIEVLREQACVRSATQERRVSSLRDVVWYNMTNRLLSSDHVLLWHLEAVIEVGRERSCFALSCDEEEIMRAKHERGGGGVV